VPQPLPADASVRLSPLLPRLTAAKRETTRWLVNDWQTGQAIGASARAIARNDSKVVRQSPQ